MAFDLKSEAYTYDFTSVVLLEPAGIPLKSMDELFNVYSAGVGKGVSGQNIINAPEASGRELNGIEKMRKINKPNCFSKYISIPDGPIKMRCRHVLPAANYIYNLTSITLR